MIPKNIYFTYKDNSIPEIVFERWKKLNPDYNIYFYDDIQCYEFITENFGIDYGIYFNEIKIGPYKADFWRLCILYINGGIYSDVDIVPHISIETFIKNIDLCTCLAMNKKSIFQAFIATKPKNELIKQCIESFYSKRFDKNFLNNIKDCAPTYDMYNVFLIFLNKNKLKAHKDYYKKNLVIRILKETGDNYLDAYVSYKGKKIFSSRDKNYVNMNLYGIPWGRILPLGNYCQTSKNIQIQNDIMNLECLNLNGKFIKNKIKITKDVYYENINGFIYKKSEIDNIINENIPNNIFQSEHQNKIKIKGFKYKYFDNKEKDFFIMKHYNDIYNNYSQKNEIIKNYIWSICVVHKYGGIYVDNHLEIKIDYSYFLKKSDFVSLIDITKKINFNLFSARKNSRLLEYIIHNIFNSEKYNIIDKDDILEISTSDNPVKILKIPGILYCDNIPFNFQEKYCQDIFITYVDKSKELLYIHKINDNNGWKQNLKFHYYYQNISEVLCNCVNDYLLSNNLPLLDNNNFCDYENYNSNIMNLEYILSYSESL